jgi:hypothetical protein
MSSENFNLNNDRKMRTNSINTNYESLNGKNNKDIDHNYEDKDRFKINLNYKEIIRSKSGMKKIFTKLAMLF